MCHIFNLEYPHSVTNFIQIFMDGSNIKAETEVMKCRYPGFLYFPYFFVVILDVFSFLFECLKYFTDS